MCLGCKAYPYSTLFKIFVFEKIVEDRDWLNFIKKKKKKKFVVYNLWEYIFIP